MKKFAKGYRGYITNDPTTNIWAEQIGRLMVNFGGIEMQTYFWLEALSDDDNEVIEASKKQFFWRLNRIKKLIKESDFDDKIKTEMNKVWGHADELSKFRNKVAHSPLLFSYKSREAEGEPDQIGVPSFRKSKSDQAPFTTVPLCTFEKLKLAVGAAHENACNLSNLYEEHFN